MSSFLANLGGMSRPIAALVAAMIVLSVSPLSAGATSSGRSPSNRKVIFSMCESPGVGCRHSALFTTRADGNGRAVRVSPPEERDTAPEWSPDGRRVVFQCDVRGAWPGRSDICVMDADGSRRRVVVGGAPGDYDPSWSPDGTQIVFSRHIAEEDAYPISSYFGGPNFELFVVGADGKGMRRLTTSPGSDLCPDWSPDGESILYLNGLTDDLRVIDADGSSVRSLTLSLEDEECGAWSPDGGSIVFSRYENDGQGFGSWNLHIMDGDGSNVVRVGSPKEADGLGPRWSDDGKSLIFYDLVGGEATGIFSIGVNGQKRKRVYFDGRWADSPDW